MQFLVLFIMVFMAQPIEDALVLIDEAYLSRISKHFGNGTYIHINYKNFGVQLAKEVGLWCKDVILYTAPPYQSSNPSQDEAERKRKYDTFVFSLRKKGIKVREGRCQKTVDDFRQKGVDSLIVRDLCLLPDGIRHIILVSADTDFVPIIEELKNKGVKTTVFYYSDFKRKSELAMLSNHLLKVSYHHQMLSKNHFDKSRIN
jgi:uncharacterized LabA/DUF88 family protein